MSIAHRPPPGKPPVKGLPPKAPPLMARPAGMAAVAPAPAMAAPAMAAPIVAARPPITPLAAMMPQPAAPAALPASAASLPAAVTAPAPPLRPPMASGSGIVGAIANLHPIMAAMVEAIQIYEAILIEENGYLRTNDANGVTALLDRKMNATRLYQERQRAVLSDPEATRMMTPEQRAEVVALVRALEELAKENTLLLKANMSAIEQMFEVINNAARKMRKREVSYSDAGVIRDYHNAPSTSLAYNHTV